MILDLSTPIGNKQHILHIKRRKKCNGHPWQYPPDQQIFKDVGGNPLYQMTFNSRCETFFMQSRHCYYTDLTGVSFSTLNLPYNQGKRLHDRDKTKETIIEESVFGITGSSPTKPM